MAVKVRQRNGKWWVFIDHKGKRAAKSVGERKAAYKVKEIIEAKLALGQFDITDEKKRRPFDAYFRHWLETYVKAHCKARTSNLYAHVFTRYLLPHFQQQDISAITREDVKTLVYGWLSKGLKRGTVKGMLIPLRGMFSHAVDDRHVAVNPALRVFGRSRKEDGERAATFLTREELGLLLRTCQEHFPAYYPFVSLLARTGLRFGEAIALQWGDIDWHGRFLLVQRNLVNGKEGTPKSGKSRRVDMSLQLTETLKALLLERKKETLREGWREVPPWIFTTETGTPLTPGNFHSRVWRPLLSKAKLRHIRVHDLRHTFASLLIQNGESLAYVKEQMGHHSIQITVDIYGHLVPGGNRQAVDRLDGLETATIRNPDATSTTNSVSESGVSA